MIKELQTDFETLWNRWMKQAACQPEGDAIIHWTAGKAPFRWTYSQLLSTSESIAATLCEIGISKGDVCAIIMRHNSLLYPLYLAVCCVGGIPSILAYPNPRLHPDKFREGIDGMSKNSGLDWLLTERDLEGTLSHLARGTRSTIRGMHFPLEWERNRRLGGELLKEVIAVHRSLQTSDPLLLQHSSGTTGLQKPVLLSHLAVLRHVDIYAKTIGLCERDKIVSWLPLYHDMGLIAAFHLPLACGVPTVILDPFEWVLVPSLLLEVVSKERGTISWLPNFAFNMMSDKIRDDELVGIDLGSWRMVINCSEPVRFESHTRFLDRFMACGLKPLALSSCYAMAETTFAVTQTPAKRAGGSDARCS